MDSGNLIFFSIATFCIYLNSVIYLDRYTHQGTKFVVLVPFNIAI